MKEDIMSQEVFDIDKSPIKEAYVLLGAKTPQELSRLYTAEDQRLIKSHEWDYKNPELLTNKIKDILESINPEILTRDEQEWRSEILWFWYHHAISTAISRYKDLVSAREFADKATEYQSDDHPNKITKILQLLVNDKLEEAEEFAKTIPTESVESETAQYLIDNYKDGGALNIVY
jgi:hypothetical protein